MTETPASESTATTEPSGDGNTVAARAHARMNDLRPAERRVARVLLADYPSAGLNTVADLARRASVSAPTVVRCAQALGYDRFSGLQTALRVELTQRSKGPISRARWQPEKGSQSELLLRRARLTTDTVLESLTAIPAADLDRAIELLADASRRTFLAGGRFTRTLAEYLALHLEQVRPRVTMLRDPLRADLGRVLDVSRRDVFVLCDVKRYERDTVTLAREVRKRGATVLLITDEELSPAAADATVVLSTQVSSPSPFDSLATAFVLAEMLMVPVMERLGDAARARMAIWEDARDSELLPA